MPRVRAISDGHAIAMTLRRAYLTLHRVTNARFTDSGVTADQFVVLTALAEHGPLTQQALAERIGSDSSTLRAMLALLQTRGLLTRAEHPRDGRARVVSLTPDGAALQESLFDASESVRQKMVASLTPEETRTLVTLLGRFASSLSPPEETS